MQEPEGPAVKVGGSGCELLAAAPHLEKRL